MSAESEKQTRKKRSASLRPNGHLEKARRDHGWTAAQLADKLQVIDPRTIRRWETGETFPPAEMRQRLSNIFGMSAAELGLVRQETHVPQFFSVPYRRNACFTGRDREVASLSDALRTDGRPLALCGLSGMGKTQLTIEYAYDAQEFYDAIAWVRAEHEQELVEDLVTFAGIVNLPEKYEPNQHIVIHAVLRWFQTHTDWLVIFDNVEDVNMIAPYLPAHEKGHIILTTRRQVVGPDMQKVDVEKLHPDDGATLLLRRAGIIDSAAAQDQVSQQDQEKAVVIAHEMDGLPLALDQAGAYIEGGRCSVAEYLERYRTRRQHLLSNRGPIQRGHPDSVVTSFMLLFERVQQRNPAAIELLRFCAFLHPDMIAQELVYYSTYEPGTVLSHLVTEPAHFHDALDELLRYSLVRLLVRSEMLTMHRLVQDVLQDMMEETRRQRWMESVIHVVYRLLLQSDSDTMQGYGRYIPHAQRCKSFIDRCPSLCFAEAAYLLIQGSRYFRLWGAYTHAKEYAERAVQIIELIGSPSHGDRAMAYMTLAHVYQEQEQYKEAKPYFQRAIALCEQQSPPRDEAVLALYLSSLARCEMHLRHLAEAEQTAAKAVSMIEAIQGVEYRDVAYCLTILGAVYVEQEKYPEARQIHERVRTIREQIHPAGHPDIAESLNTLATVYVAQGEYEQALQLNQQAIAIYENAYGRKHPRVALYLTCLCDSYLKQGDLARAQECTQEALDIYRETIGEEHPRVIMVLGTLAVFAHRQKEYKEAQGLYVQALHLAEKFPDEDIAWLLQLYILLMKQAKHYESIEIVKAHFKGRLLEKKDSNE